jgi:hypothetical protein
VFTEEQRGEVRGRGDQSSAFASKTNDLPELGGGRGRFSFTAILHGWVI